MTTDIQPLPPFWKWDNAIPQELIDLARREVTQMPLERGLLHGSRVASEDVRKSDVLMTHPTHWLCGVLFNYAVLANLAANWGRQIVAPQTVQFAKYSVEDHYDWHADTHLLSPAPVARKITSICLLSRRSEFEGGWLEIEGCAGPIELEQGSIIAFPSVLRHRVTPVTAGERISATCWAMGDTRW